MSMPSRQRQRQRPRQRQRQRQQQRQQQQQRQRQRPDFLQGKTFNMEGSVAAEPRATHGGPGWHDDATVEATHSPRGEIPIVLAHKIGQVRSDVRLCVLVYLRTST